MARGGSDACTLYSRRLRGGLDDFDDLLEMDDRVYRELPVELHPESVRERFPEVFAWLDLLDTNVIVVIVLMVIVAIINMTSALLMRHPGAHHHDRVLKALGASNGAIRRMLPDRRRLHPGHRHPAGRLAGHRPMPAPTDHRPVDPPHRELLRERRARPAGPGGHRSAQCRRCWSWRRW
ncbi:MAG: hypothetical protein R2810_00610 [Flavobacteriales bacterium]